MPRKNPEDKRTYNKQYYLENREAMCAQYKQYHLENREAVLARKKQYRLENPERIMFCSAKNRSKEAGLAFDIKLEDIKIPTHCPLLDFPLVVGGGYNSPSLDRKDSTKGYTRENIWVISWRANDMKSDASLSEMELLVKNWREKCSVGR
jgi:hypothetical protein